MTHTSPILAVADAYAAATGLAETTISTKALRAGTKLSALRSGADITTGRMARALEWFSANWPAGANWPATVARPYVDGPAA